MAPRNQDDMQIDASLNTKGFDAGADRMLGKIKQITDAVNNLSQALDRAGAKGAIVGAGTGRRVTGPVPGAKGGGAGAGYATRGYGTPEMSTMEERLMDAEAKQASAIDDAKQRQREREAEARHRIAVANGRKGGLATARNRRESEQFVRTLNSEQQWSGYQGEMKQETREAQATQRMMENQAEARYRSALRQEQTEASARQRRATAELNRGADLTARYGSQMTGYRPGRDEASTADWQRLQAMQRTQVFDRLGAVGGLAVAAGGVYGVGRLAASGINIDDMYRRQQQGLTGGYALRGASAVDAARQSRELIGVQRQQAIEFAGSMSRETLAQSQQRLTMFGLSGAQAARVTRAAGYAGVVGGSLTGQGGDEIARTFTTAVDRMVGEQRVDPETLRNLESTSGLPVYSMVAQGLTRRNRMANPNAPEVTEREARAMAQQQRLGPNIVVNSLVEGFEKLKTTSDEITTTSLPLMAQQMRETFDQRVVAQFGAGIRAALLPGLRVAVATSGMNRPGGGAGLGNIANWATWGAAVLPATALAATGPLIGGIDYIGRNPASGPVAAGLGLAGAAALATIGARQGVAGLGWLVNRSAGAAAATRGFDRLITEPAGRLVRGGLGALGGMREMGLGGWINRPGGIGEVDMLGQGMTLMRGGGGRSLVGEALRFGGKYVPWIGAGLEALQAAGDIAGGRDPGAAVATAGARFAGQQAGGAAAVGLTELLTRGRAPPRMLQVAGGVGMVAGGMVADPVADWLGQLKDRIVGAVEQHFGAGTASSVASSVVNFFASLPGNLISAVRGLFGAKKDDRGAGGGGGAGGGAAGGAAVGGGFGGATGGGAVGGSFGAGGGMSGVANTGGFGGASLSAAQSSQNAELAQSMAAAGVPMDTIAAMCGPLAAQAVAKSFGVNVGAGQLAAAAHGRQEFAYAQRDAQGNLITTGGVTNAQTGLPNMLSDAGLKAIALDEAQAVQAASAGKPVVFNTERHYFTAQGMKGNLIDFGASGEAMSRYGGKRYMTLDEMKRAGGAYYGAYTATPKASTGSGIGGLERVRQDAAASGLNEEGQKVAMAIANQEAGMSGKRGDQGTSAGTFMFHAGGQLDAFAASMGMSNEQALTALQQNPMMGNQFALGGYLGNKIKEGQQMGLHGALLATHAGGPGGQGAQKSGLFGQSYTSLFPQGGPGSTAPAAEAITGGNGGGSLTHGGDTITIGPIYVGQASAREQAVQLVDQIADVLAQRKSQVRQNAPAVGAGTGAP